MVFNGDVLSGADLTQMLAAHHDTGAELTLHLVRVSDPRAFGCVPTDDTGRVLAFLEKTEDPPTDQINAGTYIFNRSIIDRIPRPRGVGGTRGFPCPAQRRRQGLRLRRLQLLARHGHPRGLRPRLVRSGARPGAVTRARGQRGESLVHDGASVAPVRC